jgi:iron complex outermembrane receptor protein
LSLLSLGLNDQVKIQHGTASSLYGSGSLGGTLSLSNSATQNGTSLSASQWFGSFGTFKNRLKASYTNDKFYINIKAMWDQSDNDFEFDNSTKPGVPKEYQQGANYKLFGSALESGIKLTGKSQLQLSAQYFNANRNLQPSMNANFPTNKQEDENIRIKTHYSFSGDEIKWNTYYAYLHDVIGFNGAKTFADQQVIRVEFEHILWTWLNINVAGDYNYIQIRSPFYAATNTYENRGNIWTSFLVSPIERLIFSLNLRQSYNADYDIPFTPSLGAEYLLINRTKHLFRLKTQIAKGFRVPTLNERFWQPGGNLDLIPEESYSAEFGFEGQVESEINFNYELTSYRMWVDNWILWSPNGSFWSPENIKYVDAYGLEAKGGLKHKIGQASTKWLANYAYTKSINRTGLDQFDRSVNKQLVYVPIHKASLTSITTIDDWFLLLNAAFTGERFVTADNEESLPGYTLVNIRLGKSFKRGNYLFSGHGNVNNLLNTNYQSIENMAMPGINFLIGLTVSYNNP